MGIAWEGEALSLGIGKSLVANNAFTARQGGPDPGYSRTQGGGSIGGPIIKDNLFFVGTYDLNSCKEPQNVLLGGDAARAPASLNLSQYAGQDTSTFREHLGLGKLTCARSERSTFDVSTTIRNETDFRGFGGQASLDDRRKNSSIGPRDPDTEWLRQTYEPITASLLRRSRWISISSCSALSPWRWVA